MPGTVMTPGARTTTGPLGLGAFAIGTELFVVAGVLPGLAADLGVPVGSAGLAVTVFALAYAVGAPVLGALLYARPLRQVLIGSLSLVALFNLGSALAPTLAALLVARAGSALAAAAYAPAAGAAAIACAPEDGRGRALGAVLTGSALATVCGAPLGVLLAGLLSWRAAFALVALLAVATAAGLARGGLGADPPPRSTLAERLRPLRSPAVAGTLAVTFLAMAASNSSFTYLALLVDGPLGPSIALFGIAGLAGTRWGAAAVDRLGSRRVAAAALVVLGAGLAALPHLDGPAALPVVVAWGAAAWGLVAAQQHRVAGLGPAPLLLALNSSAVHLGFAAGAVLGGVVVDRAGAGALGLIPLACCGAGLVLHGMLTKEVRS
ncbi:MAG TPA: MFS transporter [Pseudonocardia sp.]|jgi:predicted MFS family arabinose efflux permease|uniref:MFS transporter n=1 Tax=Pseudonocardia sp. TaxID=60912 RepID=UPI002B4AB3E5|nr:MFS transporter [Pseudonocardia sp.]HLU55147.1 MFS transporter [Pseudonocardia sp.]